MITIIDYGAGNLRSVAKAFEHLGNEVEITSSADEVRRAQRIVLPGVGNFSAMRALNDGGVRDAVVEAIARGAPFLGICLGLQWLFEGSEESAELRGLGVFRGMCARFNSGLKVPHVGWNSIELTRPSRLLAGVPDGSYVYYTHSYRAPVVGETVGATMYGERFTAAVERDNVLGVQFHPEKSGEAGLRMLGNFAELAC